MSSLKILLIGICCAFTFSVSFSQDCTQTLRSARATYDQGRLHDLPALLKPCLSSLTKAEKVEAYKMLVLTHFYLEQPTEADDAMISLLNADHFFEPADTDPAEFVNFYKKFRTKPLFRIGLRGGLNTTGVNVIQNHNVFASASGKGTYAGKAAFTGGLSFEKDITKNITINTELLTVTRSFSYNNPTIFSIDNVSEESNLNVILAQNLAQLNLMVQYSTGKKFLKGKLDPYAGGGLAPSYLLNSVVKKAETEIERLGDPVSSASIDNTPNYKRFNMAAIVLIGARFQIGDVYLTADFRYQHGVGNIVKSNVDYTSNPNLNKLVTEHGYIDNDISLRQAAFTIGLMYPYFRPKKLIK